MANKRHVLVIGAGASGLAAIKSCKEESLEVICYEKSKNFGGRWRYNESSVPGVASVMKATVCLSSKEMEAFSDFPPPANFPNYLHNTKMLEYLTLYAQEFNLLQHIRYQREVIRLVPSPEFEKNGRWLVTSSNGFNFSQVTEEFDAVMVCTGRLSHPNIPDIPSKNEFKGIRLHSQSVKDVSTFENLKVLILGNGNSAVDAAVQISTVAQQVYLSVKNGFWVYPKLGPSGLPFDMFLIRRNVQFLKNMCSTLVNYYVEKYIETKINHQINGIKPSHRAMDELPITNDDLPDKILTGSIIIKGKISTFEKNGVSFEGEDDATQLDAVIFATGYKMELPFLDKEFYRNNSSILNTYKRVFPVALKHATLAFVGFVESLGPQIPISESQCRWASRVFAQKVHLPSEEVINVHMKAMHEKIKGKSRELMEDYIPYMDELAEEYGAKPDICSLLFKDTKLFWACFSGPSLPYQYRLVGPYSLATARNLILECNQRVKQPLETRHSMKRDNGKGLDG